MSRAFESRGIAREAASGFRLPDEHALADLGCSEVIARNIETDAAGVGRRDDSAIAVDDCHLAQQEVLPSHCVETGVEVGRTDRGWAASQLIDLFEQPAGSHQAAVDLLRQDT